MRVQELTPTKIRWTREPKRLDVLTRFVSRWKLRDARCVLLYRNAAFKGPPLVYASRTTLVFDEVKLPLGPEGRITSWGIVDLKGRLMIQVPTDKYIFTPRVKLTVLVNWECEE